jgi:hypothetical protein
MLCGEWYGERGMGLTMPAACRLFTPALPQFLFPV